MKLLPERLETNRLKLQRLRYEDAEEIFYAYASKKEATQFVLWPTHQTIEDTNEYLRYCARAWDGGHNYVYSIRLKFENRLIGSLGVVNDLGNIHFGYVISPTHWNNGYATEAASCLIDILSKQDEVFKIWTFVDADNRASCRVLDKIGLKEEARISRWRRFANQANEPKDCIFYDFPLGRK
ncbi:MAG: GNAT family N-acetyltransferase [Cyclobacteriaceae bacterium]